jgi:hypothetical protein
MTNAPKPLPIATKVGFWLLAITLLWWFAYYANYEGAFGLMKRKIMCINGATYECLFYQKMMGPTAIPTYYPIFWYAGLIALAIGAYQSWQARRAK